MTGEKDEAKAQQKVDKETAVITLQLNHLSETIPWYEKQYRVVRANCEQYKEKISRMDGLIMSLQEHLPESYVDLQGKLFVDIKENPETELKQTEEDDSKDEENPETELKHTEEDDSKDEENPETESKQSEEDESKEEEPLELGVEEQVKFIGKVCMICGGQNKQKKWMRAACGDHWMCTQHDPVVGRILRACRLWEENETWQEPSVIAKLHPCCKINACVLCAKGVIPEWTGKFREFCLKVQRELHQM